MLNMTEFVIQGNYKPTEEENETVIDYQIKPIPFGYWWIRLMIPIALTAMSILLLVSFRTEALTEVIIMWFWLGIPWLFALWRSKKLKQKLERKFKELFKIN